MDRKRLVALPFVLASGVALAQQSMPTVEVRRRLREIDGHHLQPPAQAKAKDVERVLQIPDPKQTPGLRKQLMEAAAEGCKAGIPRIQVTRTGYMH